MAHEAEMDHTTQNAQCTVQMHLNAEDLACTMH